MREQQHLTSYKGGHVSGQQVGSLTLKLPQPAGIKDQTLKYQEAARARWLLSVIPAGAQPLCVCEKPPGIWLRLGGKCGSCTLAGEELVPPSARSRGSRRWRHPYSSQAWSYFLSQFLHLWVKHCYPGYNPVQVGVPNCALFLFQHPRKCQRARI